MEGRKKEREEGRKGKGERGPWLVQSMEPVTLDLWVLVSSPMLSADIP